MMTLTRWNPFREVDDVQSRMMSLFGRGGLRANGPEAFENADWAPCVDVTEDEKEYLIKAELPEVKKEDVKVTTEKGLLKISGERKFQKETKERKYHRIERSYGSFERTFTLPEGARVEGITAEYHDGVLSVHLPKGEKAQPKQVEVKVN